MRLYYIIIIIIIIECFRTISDFLHMCNFRKKPQPTKVESANQERTQEANVVSENKDVEEAAQSSEATNGEKPNPAEETDTNVLPSSQGTAEPALGPSENPPQQECPDSPPAPPQSPPSPRPHSPSRYMKRLPPPPGFYLPKEHSYAQLCPLVWRRRCDRAIDCLEKAMRQLSAARRRENRLRNTLLRLREKRFKHTLLLSRDSTKSRGGRPADLENGQCRGRGSSLASQESEMDVETEDMGLFEDRPGEPMDWGGWVPSTDSRAGSEEEGGYCFYCGRGREDDGGRVAGRVSKTRKDGQATARGGPLRSCINERGGEYGKRLQVPKRFQGQKKATTPPASEAQASPGSHENRHYSYGMGKGAAEDMRLVMLERLPGKGAEATLNLHGSSQPPIPQVLLPSHAQADLQPQVTSAGGPPHNTHVQYLQPGLSSQQGLLLSDLCSSGEAELVQQQEELLQQVFWIQESAEGQLLLIPVDDGQKNVVGIEGVAEDAQTILVSEVDFQRDFGQVGVNNEGSRLENTSRGLRVLIATDDGQGGQQSNLKGTTVVMREDVREKLKEHLEGFQLQLSHEFID